MSTVDRASTTVSKNRQIDPRTLSRLFRGELDWIVMKALEKDRTRRYETVSSFALDIQRYMVGEPVLAAPPSARYRLRKFAHKHLASLAMAAVISLLLMAGAAVSTWQAVRATRATVSANRQADARQLDRAVRGELDWIVMKALEKDRRRRSSSSPLWSGSSGRLWV